MDNRLRAVFTFTCWSGKHHRKKDTFTCDVWIFIGFQLLEKETEFTKCYYGSSGALSVEASWALTIQTKQPLSPGKDSKH